MKTLEDFTPSIAAKIPEYQQRALEGIFDGGRYSKFDLDKAKACVDWNYKYSGIEAPKWVFAAENPFEAQLMYNYILAQLNENPSLKDGEKYLGPFLPKEENIKDYLEYQENYVFTMNVYSDCYYTWYEFIRKEFELPLTINDDFQECFRLQRESGIFNVICNELFAVVSKYPTKVHWNSENQLHNLSGVAVEWSSTAPYTQFDCYYINGRNLPTEIYLAIQNNTYKVEDFFSEENEETKSTAIMYIQELHGDTALIDFLGDNLKEVDTYIDKKAEKFLEGTTNGQNIGVYTLFVGEILDEKVAYVRCYCPSTDRLFFLGVEPTHKNAKDAIASLYTIPKKLKPYIKYIQRQGERFSTVFDEKGKTLMSELSKEDLADMISITGDEYFSKMQYEY
jgi:hypothetical protein